MRVFVEWFDPNAKLEEQVSITVRVSRAEAVAIATDPVAKVALLSSASAGLESAVASAHAAGDLDEPAP